MNNLTNPYLEFTKVDGTIENTDILSIENNFINYDVPFSYYATNGTLNMRIRSDGFDSDYIGFTIQKNLSSTDNIIVKVENEKYLIKAIAPNKYYDLPIANAEGRLGIVTIGDNLVIDSSGRLSSTGGGLAATIEVGTTTTGAAGTNASVTNSGTSNAAILNFVIPAGQPGTNGTNGSDGENGREIELQVTEEYIQWRYVGDTTWYDLISLSLLKGGTGEQGIPGESNTLSIGTVTKGDEAAATITGTSPNQILNLVLPKGDTGTDGITPNIQVGETTTLSAGSDATVTQTGTTENPVLNFGIPEGTPGTDGVTPNIQVGETTTLSAGSSATVTQTGTTENPVFNFGIPKGSDGTGIGELSSEDSANPICLFDLDEGIYKIYGYIKYYPTYEGTAIIQSPSLISVAKSSTTTYVQVLEAYGNNVTGYEITATTYKEKSKTSELLDIFYPIGTYYETSNKEFDPNTSWGGTWELEEDGTALVSKSSVAGSKFNADIGTIVGSETHTLTVDEMPKHSHAYSANGQGSESGWTTNTGFTTTSSRGWPIGYIGSAGADQSHNNVQPSKIANRWHRIA